MKKARLSGPFSLFFQPIFDECAVTCLAQPILIRLIGLALADDVARGGAFAFFGNAFGAALDDLHQMPAEAGGGRFRQSGIR